MKDLPNQSVDLTDLSGVQMQNPDTSEIIHFNKEVFRTHIKGTSLRSALHHLALKFISQMIRILQS